MTPPSSPLNFVPTLPPEEAARANFYALLARLFYAPPDEKLLQAIAGSESVEEEEGEIGAAWNALAQAAAGADPEAVREEHDAVFVGTGRSPVTPYTTAYSMRHTNEVPLVELKADLHRLGLARKAQTNEPEDHIAALCDVMRHLISEKTPLETQKHFFSRWIEPTAEALCAAIEKSDLTSFYRPVAHFAKVFFALEQEAFEML